MSIKKKKKFEVYCHLFRGGGDENGSGEGGGGGRKVEKMGLE